MFKSATICLERVTSEKYYKLALMHKLIKTYYDKTKNMAYDSQIVRAEKKLKLNHSGPSQIQARSVIESKA